MAFRQRFNLEYHPVTTEIYFSERRQSNTYQLLQNIFHYFQRFRQERAALSHREEQEETYSSTASTLRTLNQPVRRPTPNVRRRQQEEFEQEEQERNAVYLTEEPEEEEELENVLALKPQLQGRKKPKVRTRTPEPVFDPFDSLIDSSEFSATLFVQISYTVILVTNELETSLYLTNMIVFGLALGQMAHHYVSEAELELPEPTPEPLLDFGNPLPLFMPRFEQPNPLSLFAPNYYHRPVAAPRPVPVPRNEERLEALGFPMDLVPDNYKCDMLSTVMDNPVQMKDTPQICDGRAVLESFERDRSLGRPTVNPYNRQPMTMDEATPQLALRGEISNYVNAVENGIKARRQALGQGPFSLEDYQAINKRALESAKKAPAASLEAPKQEVPSTPRLGRR